MLHEIDLSRADLNLLTLFEVVLRERHVGRAAARLNLSPSAVSHGLKRLRLLLNDPQPPEIRKRRSRCFMGFPGGGQGIE